MASVAVWLVVLTLLPEVESPPLHPLCDAGEYFYSGICCKNCPAGTHVEEACNVPSTLGICKSCTDGKSYTKYENGLPHCLTCDECKPGYKMILPCTTKKNTECQCNDGYFCPPGYEECMKCRTRCPEGQVIVQNCSATTNMKCEPRPTGGSTDVFVAKTTPSTSKRDLSPSLEKPQESSASLLKWVSITPVLILLMLLGSCFIYKCFIHKSSSETEKEKEAKVCLIHGNNENVNSNVEASPVSQDKLPETTERSNLGLGNRKEDSFLPNTSSVSPSLEAALSNEQSYVRNDVLRSNKPAVRIKNPSSKELEDTYFQIKNMVGSANWNTLMRECGLSGNDIDKITHDHAYHMDEQYYQMLKTLQDRVGVVNALNKIIAGLKKMNLNGIYENVINDLKSKDLVTMEAED